MSLIKKNAFAAVLLGVIGISSAASAAVITCPQTIHCSANNVQSCEMNDVNFFIRDGKVNSGTYIFNSAQSGDLPSISACGYKRENPLIGEQDLVIIAKSKATAHVVPGSKWKHGNTICKAASSEACQLSTSN